MARPKKVQSLNSSTPEQVEDTPPTPVEVAPAPAEVELENLDDYEKLGVEDHSKYEGQSGFVVWKFPIINGVPSQWFCYIAGFMSDIPSRPKPPGEKPRNVALARLEYWRKNYGYTYRELANRAGVDAATIYRLETDYDRKPQERIVEKLAAALRVKPAELYNLYGDVANTNWEHIKELQKRPQPDKPWDDLDFVERVPPKDLCIELNGTLDFIYGGVSGAGIYNAWLMLKSDYRVRDCYYVEGPAITVTGELITHYAWLESPKRDKVIETGSPNIAARFPAWYYTRDEIFTFDSHMLPHSLYLINSTVTTYERGRRYSEEAQFNLLRYNTHNLAIQAAQKYRQDRLQKSFDKAVGN